MIYEYTSTRKIEFSETDMAGLVHFSNFFKYMETAERDFFEAAGVDLIRTKPGELVGWPRVRAECTSAPLRFGDTIDIHIAVKAVKTDQSIIISYFPTRRRWRPHSGCERSHDDCFDRIHNRRLPPISRAPRPCARANRTRSQGGPEPPERPLMPTCRFDLLKHRFRRRKGKCLTS